MCHGSSQPDGENSSYLVCLNMQVHDLWERAKASDSLLIPLHAPVPLSC